MLELLALANELHVGVPVFGYIAPKTDQEPEETAISMPQGYGLFVPRGAGPEFVYEIVSRVLDRHPELTQHAKMVVGFLRAPSIRRARHASAR
jgi:hypothetical protein